MQLYNRGIRRRLAPMLGSTSHLELAYSVLFSLPGTPVLRYGDEIGMGDDLSLNERDAVRTPMHWSNDTNAGFTSAKKPVHPVISKGPYSCEKVNVEQQRRDPNSLLNWTSRMIRLRKECPEIGWGEWKILKTGAPSVLAMRYDWQGNSVVILHNFSEQPQEARIHVGGEGGDILINLLANDESRAKGNGIHRIGIEAYGYRWFRVGGLAYALDRKKV